MISFNEMQEKIKGFGYYATLELLYDTYNSLILFNNSQIGSGQDIYAVCLDGPPGAGKTEFAKTYYKLSNEIFKNVELVEYQCDATTGKTELFEDINISAAIRGDADNVNIPGKLIEAIKNVNEGKRVILFIDEYDKAREETDAFLLQFLQSGKINSTQHGDLAIKDEYKSNLQVILCKNDFREELSGPLSRRLRMTTLSYMKPDIFYTVANRVLVNERKNKVNDSLINFVYLIYNNIYNNKDKYNRLPSCSEMLIALEDADRLMKLANAPKNIIYNIIIKNMFKSLDDKETFESILKKGENSKLQNIINSMKENTNENDNIDINELIADKLLIKEKQQLIDQKQQLEKLINEYKERFQNLEQNKISESNNEISSIQLQDGEFVKTNKPTSMSIFQDETVRVKRGYDIFNISNTDWINIGSITKRHMYYQFFLSKLIEHINELDIVIYENGILIDNIGDYKLIVTCQFKKYQNDLNGTSFDTDIEFNIFCNYTIIPDTFLSDILYFSYFINDCYDEQPKTTEAITNEVIGINDTLSIDALVYSNTNLNYDKTLDNVYQVSINNQKELKQLNNLIENSNNQLDYEKIKEASKQLIEGKVKVKK